MITKTEHETVLLLLFTILFLIFSVGILLVLAFLVGISGRDK
jgi:hypothetical protein